MPLSESKYKKMLFDKVQKSLSEIGDYNQFLAPVEALMNRTDIDEKTKRDQIESYFRKNFNKFQGIEEVRKILKVPVEDIKKGP